MAKSDVTIKEVSSAYCEITSKGQEAPGPKTNNCSICTYIASQNFRIQHIQQRGQGTALANSSG